MRTVEDKLWAGTRDTLITAKRAEELHAARISAGWSDNEDDDEEDDDEIEHDLLQVVGNIGVINISGGMVNDDSCYLKYYGLVGYPQIKGAVVAAAKNPGVKHILLNIDSGGGSVNGVQDVANLIRKVHTDLKPVDAYTGGMMASAAYWIGSSAGTVHASQTAVVGSIGVLATHKEYSKMYAEMGVGVTVVRSGEYKALANPNEPLNEKGLEQLQALVDATNEVFVSHVATMRNRTAEYVDSTMGGGREFVGASAADVGLVDSVTSLDALVSQLQRRYIDNEPARNDTRTQQIGFRADTQTEIQMATPNTLTDQEIQALKAGKPQSQDAAPEAAADAPKEADTFAEALALLNASLSERDATIVDLRVQLAQTEKALADAKALAAPMVAVVEQSLSNMRVALGGVAVVAGSLNEAQLVAAHAETVTQYAAKFPVGGVAAAQPGTEAHAKSKSLSGLEAARLGAVLNPKSK